MRRLLTAITLLLCSCGPQLDLDDAAPATTAESTSQALGTCAVGDEPNARFSLPTSGPSSTPSYTRTWLGMAFCEDLRETTIVEFLGVIGARYQFRVEAPFRSLSETSCDEALLAVRLQRQVGTQWVEFDYMEVKPIMTGAGECKAGFKRALFPGDYSPAGRYRVRAKAIRPNGSMDTVTVSANPY